MDFPLRATQKQELKEVHKSCKKAYLADKVKAIAMLDRGDSPSSVSEALMVCEKTIYNWKKEFIDSDSMSSFIEPRENHYHGKLGKEKKTSSEISS